MLPSHKRAMDDIVNCRTPALGGQVYECKDCHEIDYSYHSCMNRHCPKCMNDQAEKWQQKQKKLLLPVPYFLVTFPLPAELREPARSHQKDFYDIAFKASAESMQKLARDPKFIGGDIGFMGVLHTWKRDLNYHPHVHYLVPGGGVSKDKTKWLPAQDKFFLPVEALSKIFRAKFRDALKEKDLELFKKIPSQVWRKDWVVHCKPAGTGKAVLKYFAPYVFRVALSNRRLVKLENGHVSFRYKDSETKKWRSMTLSVFEFIRRFLQHVLPAGFKKVRHYGFLSSKHKETLALLKYILGTVEFEADEEPTQEPLKHLCPKCGKEMVLIGTISRTQTQRAPP
jgi:Zn finger protein HypA/HybF involved in hydrogenase expression